MLQLLAKYGNVGSRICIALGKLRQHANAPRPVALLSPRRNRPSCRAAEEGDEVAPLHYSMTSSASAINVGGTLRPSTLAVCRLITSSNLVVCITGRSPGFSPLRIRPT